MNRNLRIDEKDTVHNVYGLRKVSFWEKYGVKRFPYHRRRRYSPFVYRSVDGGMVISNDVFGLTIRQFDRMYKACLIRRKTHEQYILNLRFTDKSSDEYMEYLQDNKDNDKDYMSWKGNHSNERYLFEHLVNTAGTEIEIRTRQQLFITQDMINNTITQTLDIPKKEISSGSLAEGIDLPDYSPDMVTIGGLNYDDRQVNHYINNVHSTMTLQDKMRMAVVSYVNYIKHSSLIPKEFQLEVKDQSICLTPSDLSHCLRFLCYHHIGDICNRQQALCNLMSTVRDSNLLDVNCLSNSLTILGVCYEISGDKNAAYQSYDEALQCEGFICATAEARRLKLLTDTE